MFLRSNWEIIDRKIDTTHSSLRGWEAKLSTTWLIMSEFFLCGVRSPCIIHLSDSLPRWLVPIFLRAAECFNEHSTVQEVDGKVRVISKAWRTVG